MAGVGIGRGTLEDGSGDKIRERLEMKLAREMLKKESVKQKNKMLVKINTLKTKEKTEKNE
jgi:hypothetical protein